MSGSIKTKIRNEAQIYVLEEQRYDQNIARLDQTKRLESNVELFKLQQTAEFETQFRINMNVSVHIRIWSHLAGLSSRNWGATIFDVFTRTVTL